MIRGLCGSEKTDIHVFCMCSLHYCCLSWLVVVACSQTVLFSRSSFGAPSGIEKRIVTEAALSTSVVHPNVVATFHYDIKQVKQRSDFGVGVEPSALQIEDATGSDWKLFLVQVHIRRAVLWDKRCTFGFRVINSDGLNLIQKLLISRSSATTLWPTD